ncbi:MAG: polynucleotide adenylyltransferase [Bacilli bacterium]|nr:polynucleotide adenylyltransferase [Bacilli bacterium]
MYELGLEILSILFQHKFESYIVGGFPRDMYLGIESDDIDITTNASLEDLQKIFNNIKENGFMSYILEYKEHIFQITTFRKDTSYMDNRKPDIQERVDTIEEDLQRRDFIINTLCINRNGKYVDLLGAKEDIDNKIIRTVKEPNISFREDALRMLRCIRFSSILGFTIDENTKKAIIANKELIKGLSFFRKKQELDKIFSDINYQRGLDLIKELDLEEVLSIKIGNNIYADDYLNVWSNIEFSDEYPFTRKEKAVIELYRQSN